MSTHSEEKLLNVDVKATQLQPWHRVHADSGVQFLQKYNALLVIDSYSKWPEADAVFTLQAPVQP